MKKRITRRSSENSESGESDHEDGSSMKNNNNNNKPLPKKTALKKAKTTPLVPDVPTVVENSEKEESNEEDIVSEDKVIDDGDDNEDFDDDEDDDEEDDIVTGQIAGPLTPSGTQGPQKGQQSLLEGKLPLSMWQLPERAMLTCFKDLLCWRGRMGKFVSKPLINDKKSDEGQAEMSERIKELRFLVLEYSSLWLYGHSLTSDDERQMDANHTAPNPMAVTFCLFFGKSTELNLTPSAVESAYLPLHQDVMALVEQHKKYKYFDNDNAEHNTSLTKVNNVRTALQQGYYMLLHAAGVSIAIDPHKSAIMPSKNVLHYVENSNHLKDRMAEAKPILQCVLYLLNILSQNRYRRYKDSVYEEHYTAEGYATSFWKRIGTIDQFVSQEINKEANYSIWAGYVEGKLHKSLVDHLTAQPDADFPDIRIDRHVFSFRNGIYFCATNTFKTYESGSIQWVEDSFVSARKKIGVVPVSNRHGPTGDKTFTNASANYFDEEFINYMDPVHKVSDWFDIPTPTLTKIFTDQKIPRDAQEVIFGFLGRLFYEVGELDDWQVILWILGIANSGKSTLCKLVQIFYQDEDVAVISNNVEEQFGLMSVYDKLVFMAPEVKRDWRLNQAEFQSMVTGEKMSIARKFQAAAQDIFNVPGMIAGNDMPSWMDNSGSVVRRVILVMFNEVIRKVNGEISNMLRAEVAATILKSNQAYHVMLKNYGSSGIWENLPAYFTASQDKLKAKTHPVYDFLRSETLVFGEDLCVPMQRFRTEFMTHCKMNGLKREPWKEELYMVPLMEKKLEIKMVDELEWHGRIYKRVQFIYGVDIVENDTFNDAGGELSYTGGIDSAEKGHGHKQGGSAKKQRTMTGNQSHTSHSSHSVPKSKFTSFAEVPVLPPMVDF